MAEKEQATTPVVAKKKSVRHDTRSAAKYIGGDDLAPRTLDAWRSSGKVKIPYIKIGSKVFYDESDLDAFIASCKIGADQ